MDTLKQIILLIIIVAVVMFIFSLYVRLLGKISQKAIKSRIAKGKVTDEQLIKFYNIAEKKRNNNKWMAILFFGIFYKSYAQLQEGTYQMYREEMQNRGLLDKAS